MATKRALANYGGVRREMADTDTLPKINLQELIIGTITAGITDQSPSSASVFTALAGKVNTTGNETIAGLKTFTSEIRAYNAGAGAGLVALCADEGFVADLIHARGINVRWRHRMKSDAGADFQMIGYSDAGAATTVFTTSRTSYVVDFKQRPTYLGTNLALTSEVVLIGADIEGPGAASSFDITQGTSDGADDSRTGVAGGGSFSNTRGAYLLLNGNEYATDPGRALLTAGLNSPVRIIAPGTGNVSLESTTGIVEVLAAGLYVGTQSGGGVGLLRIEASGGARAGFTSTGQRRFTIGNNATTGFSIRDESAAVDRLNISASGVFDFLGGRHSLSASQLYIGDGTTNQTIFIDAQVGGLGDIRFQTGGANRWLLRRNGAAESGGNAGSDLQLYRYSDGGTPSEVLSVARSTGVFNFATAPTIAGNPLDSRAAKLFPTTANATTTLGASHLNGAVEKTNTTAYTYTLAPALGEQGDAITIVNSGTAGNITIARGTGVALYRNGVDANVTVPPGSWLTLYRSATSNRWVC